MAAPLTEVVVDDTRTPKSYVAIDIGSPPRKRARVAVDKADTPTDKMPTVSPVGMPPGYTTRDTTAEEMEKVDKFSLGAPADKGKVRSHSVKGLKGDLKARFGGKGRRRTLRRGGGDVYTDNGLPYESKNPQELAAGKMLNGGRRGTLKVRIPIKNTGDLANLGYSMSKKARTRHGALKKAVKKFGRTTVSRKLNALAVFNKRRHPVTARKARADRKYVMKV